MGINERIVRFSISVHFKKTIGNITDKRSLEWNPTIKSDCSGLYVGWWVCIGIQPQTVTETFEYTITPPPLSVPPSPTKYTPTTFPPINSSFTYTPTLPDLSTDCEGFHQATAVGISMFTHLHYHLTSALYALG